ncbi:integrase [Variovorax boronicumulans]|uniref:Integrase n=1 Tax=Variovorax boronicumulans TaxID=436515 RepID=A0AAW8CYQ5_9BURK|nr:site-specific integrase [Variovorax boronicumulans]MDP9895327.1 integrase [Variovorax boronicumulans]MDQ0055367.1 integrase [Variovorax boronicumulans]
MSRPRDRESNKGLLPRMEARPLKAGGFSYRYHPLGEKPIALGRDLQAALQQVLDMNGRSSDRGTVGRLWRLYQEPPEFKRLAETTKVQYRDNWKKLAERFEKTAAGAIRPPHIARYLRKERASAPIVANREVALLSNLFNLAVELGEIERNPCKEVRRNRETPRDRLVEKSELAPFVAWALQQGPSAVVLVSMAQFAALAGNRRAEFLKLHWPQVDDEVVRLQRAKQHGGTTKRELVGVSDSLKEVLDRMRAAEGFSPMGAVFRAPRTGNPYTEAGFKAMWGRLMKKAIQEKIVETRFTFHDLRGHYTTYFKLKFGALPELHADAKTTAAVYERSREVRRSAL